MKNSQTTKQKATQSALTASKQRSYNEIVDYLDKHWVIGCSQTSITAMKQLDQAFGNIMQKIPTILVTGINGKSLTAHFASKLLKEEGVNVGSFYSPHILTYNERLAVKNELIANKIFTDIGNEVINMAELSNIQASSREILLMMAFLYFKQCEVDAAVFEVSDISQHHPLTLSNPKVVAVTRINELEKNATGDSDATFLDTVLGLVKPGTFVVSADQSKSNLQLMQSTVEKLHGSWVMPIRKLAPLTYPFEQLHGRCAALAERIAQIYIENAIQKEGLIVTNSLLAKKEGKRGRPTLETKRQSELNPKRTIEQLWKETLNTLPGRFQLLEKEKPMVLLDNATNLDALTNLFLGIRLLHYQRVLKGLVIITDCCQASQNMEEYLKLLRYFFRKTSGQIIVCQSETIAGEHTHLSWNTEQVTNDIKSMMKIKAHATKNFQEAFQLATSTVDERNGLIVITGSSSIISNYWQYKGVKKVQ